MVGLALGWEGVEAPEVTDRELKGQVAMGQFSVKVRSPRWPAMG